MCLILQTNAVGIFRSTNKWQVQCKSNNKVNTKYRGVSILFRENKREAFLDKVEFELNFERSLDYCVKFPKYFTSSSSSCKISWCHFSIKNNAPPPSSTKKGKTHIHEELQNLASARLFFNFLYLLSHHTGLSSYHWVSGYLLSINTYRGAFQPNPNLSKIPFVYLLDVHYLFLKTDLTSTAH